MNIEELAERLPLVLSLLAVPLALVAGYALGMRHSRRARRELQRALGARSLELLDARAERARLATRLEGGPRRERLLRLVLARLRESRQRERGRFVAESRLRLRAAESAERARKAGVLARRAAARVRELEETGAATGTITTRAAKSYGNGRPVTVSVVDQETPEARLDGISRVSHLERARFARLTPSNEACRPEERAAGRLDGLAGGTDGGRHDAGGLRLIDGLAAADEDRLNAFGIHDLEQLARLSESEQRMLDRHILDSVGPRPLGDWIGNARALIGNPAPL